MLCRVPAGYLDGKPFVRCAEQASKLPGWSYQLERTHWTSHLNSKINKSLFTHDNNIKLFCAHKEFGKMWLNILEKVFDCTREYQVKNRVSSMIVFILRGGIRQLISSCFPLCSSQYDSGILYHSRSLPQPSNDEDNDDEDDDDKVNKGDDDEGDEKEKERGISWSSKYSSFVSWLFFFVQNFILFSLTHII